MTVSLACPHRNEWTKRTIDGMFFVLAEVKMGLASFVASS